MDLEQWNEYHQNQTEKDVSKLLQLLDEVLKMAVLYYGMQALNKGSDLFTFALYPVLNKKINSLFERFQNTFSQKMNFYVDKHYNISHNKFKDVFGEALKSGKAATYTTASVRKHLPMEGIRSARVWNLSKQYRTEIEMALDIAISEGTPANELASTLKKYLRNPDSLFRRYRDKNGVLQLSKKAKEYHSGQGVYRSAYKNAERLARTEINIAYRKADIERWQSMDMIAGYEIKRSRHPYGCEICDMMKGVYPKSFVWVGNHPNCRCYMAPIFKADLKGKELTLNPKLTNWIASNEEKITTASSVPMFLWGMNDVPVKPKILTLDECKKYIKKNNITEDLFNHNGIYIKERQVLHNRIINDYFNQEKELSDKVFMLGGAPANGKSTLTESGLLPHPKGGLVIDPDKVKAMIPEYKMILESGDKELIRKAANFVHEESSYLGKKIRDKALKEEWATIIDGVNNGTAEKIHRNAQLIRKLSGKKIRADYVSLDTDLSMKLAEMRAKKTGREVPLEVIRDKNIAISKEFPLIIKNKSFDELYLWDTNINGQPRLILRQLEGELEVIDKDLYQKFLQKAN